MYNKYSIQFICETSKTKEKKVITVKESDVSNVTSIADLGMKHGNN